MTMFRLPISVCSVIAATMIVLSPGRLTASAAQGAGEVSANPVCLVRVGADGKPLAIIVPAVSERAMIDKGFEPQSCEVSFATIPARETYRDVVCHMASSYREDQISVFERRYGERPGVLCGMAQVAVSEWRLND